MFGQKIGFDFEMSVFTFVRFRNSEYKSLLLIRFISVARGCSSKHGVCLNDLLKYDVAKRKTLHKAKIFIPKSNLSFSRALYILLARKFKNVSTN